MIFTPIISAATEQLLNQRSLLFDLRDSLGSTFNVILISNFIQNCKKFAPTGELFFASKANKSEALIRCTGYINHNIEVSSLQELQSALKAGLQGPQIIVSGPSKSQELLYLSCKANTIISIDTLAELKMVSELYKRKLFIRKPQVLIRIGDLQNTTSRFGFQLRDLQQLVSSIDQHTVDLLGFSFHLSGYSIKDREKAITTLLPHYVGLRSKGFKMSLLDIGGGFPINYIESKCWDDFQKEKGDVKFYQHKSFPSFYPYSNKLAGVEALNKLLRQHSTEGQTLQYRLKQNGIRLLIEPGRSLLDQVGLTIMTVKATRTSSTDDNLVVVDSNINSQSEQWFNSDFLPNPLLIPLNPVKKSSYSASIVGNTCMESDVLTWHQVEFQQRPQPGDLLVYCNTGGYIMDSNESEFHKYPKPEKVVMFETADNKWHWRLDNNYHLKDFLLHYDI